MSDGNRWNRTGHIALGIAAALVPGLDWYAAQREIDQTPCENDDYPAIYIWLDSGWRTVYSDSIDEVPSQFRPNVEPYWSSVRVLDSLHDTREVAIGKEIGRWVAWAGVAALGAWVF